MATGLYTAENQWSTISLDGPDRYDYLQRLSTRNLKNSKIGESFPGAFLNANGTVISLFWAHLREQDVLLIVEPQSLEKTLAFLDQYHFGEKLSFKQDSSWTWMEVRRPLTNTVSLPPELLQIPLLPWAQTKDVEQGTLIGFQDVEQAKALEKKLLSLDFQKMGTEVYDFYRMQNFIPKDQVDVGDTQIILEAGLYTHISRSKGCYPGQEVIERLFTYGNVAKKLTLFQTTGESDISAKSEIFLGDKKVGWVTSSTHKSRETFIFGVVQRTSAKVDETYRIHPFSGGAAVNARAVIVAPDVPKD